MQTLIYNMAIVGGGINGCGIARDAAGRGLSVLLCEQDDLANETSSNTLKVKQIWALLRQQALSI
jgi:glycerol-3-phosphate dehydrogenase